MTTRAPRRRGDDELREVLDAIRARCDAPARRDVDPVGLVHRYTEPEDQELVGLVCATTAFGNVKTIRAKLTDLLARVGPRPALAADDPRSLTRAVRGWKHRVFVGDDVARCSEGAPRPARARLVGRFFQVSSRARGHASGPRRALRRRPGTGRPALVHAPRPAHLLPILGLERAAAPAPICAG